MATIYVVTEGSYSDYRIIAVFDEKYKSVAQKLSKNIGGDVEEYELNQNVVFPQIPRWKVYMNRNGGTIRCDKFYQPFEKPVNTCDVTKLLPTKWRINNYAPYNMEVECFARDEVHAIKIVNEYRTKLIALGVYDFVMNQQTYSNFTDERNITETMKYILDSINEDEE